MLGANAAKRDHRNGRGARDLARVKQAKRRASGCALRREDWRQHTRVCAGRSRARDRGGRVRRCSHELLRTALH